MSSRGRGAGGGSKVIRKRKTKQKQTQLLKQLRRGKNKKRCELGGTYVAHFAFNFK